MFDATRYGTSLTVALIVGACYIDELSITLELTCFVFIDGDLETEIVSIYECQIGLAS